MIKRLSNYKLLHDLLLYEEETGNLYWKERKPEHFNLYKYRTQEGQCNNWNSRYANKRAFTAITNANYYHGRINSECFLAHRIIWKMMTGEEPDIIDHINGETLDNRFENFREGNVGLNMKNRKLRCNNTSGYNGVSYVKSLDKWHSYITIDKTRINLGYFDCKDEAFKNRLDAQLNTDFTDRHGL